MHCRWPQAVADAAPGYRALGYDDFYAYDAAPGGGGGALPPFDVATLELCCLTLVSRRQRRR